ncbi:hypothetical protein ACFZCT_31100 [Streptomyces qaidamensis]|uniref:hypothetical protein n=1 Tax=Streptomyces qaidamensis TaxID=1783515 RepID=UPI0036F0B893
MEAEVLAAVFLCLSAFLGMSGTAVAEPGTYVLVSDTAVLERHDDGTGTFTVSLINLTDRAATVSVEAREPEAGCTAVVDADNQLPVGRQASFKIKLTGCSLPDQDPFPVNIKAGTETYQLTAGPEPDPTPDWDLMKWFGIPVIAAFVLVGTASASWAWGERDVRLRTELKYLKDTWKFQDSVAADLTVLATAFTGVFAASDILEALGDKTKSVLTLALVASAVGLGLVGAAAFAVQALRSSKGYVTVKGLMLGSALALGGTAGQLWVIVLAARDLELGWIGDGWWLYGLGTAASVLLGFYGWANTRSCLRWGTTEPAQPLSLQEKSEVLATLSQKLSSDISDREKKKILKEHEDTLFGDGTSGTAVLP